MRWVRATFSAWLILFFCGTVTAQTLAVHAAKLYTSPDAKPLADVTVIVKDGKVASIARKVAIPQGAKILTCAGCAVYAGFWNTHVHFTQPKWDGAKTASAAELAKNLRQMLTRSGFTTVVDTGSDGANTIALRQRIESGEIPGPYIYTSGVPLYPFHAIPYYLKDLPPEVQAQLPQPETPEAAAEAVEKNIALGTDIVKLFTGSIVAPDRIVPMKADIARAAAEAGHRHGQLVFSHATNFEGVEVALGAGVDVLAHTPEVKDGMDDAYLKKWVDRHLTIIPTLKLFAPYSDIGNVRDILQRFHKLGGQVMFGTDTGFLTDYDLHEEYKQLYLAGFSPREVLAMLTTTPARLFRVSGHKGRIAPGMDGDLTILASDAGTDPAAWTNVKYTVRHGVVIYDAAAAN